MYCSDECKKECPTHRKHGVTFDKIAVAHENGEEYVPNIDREKYRGIDTSILNVAKAAAKERDGFSCVRCGSTHKLQIHHEIPVSVLLGADNEFLIYEIDNLITLCKTCHMKYAHAGACGVQKLPKNSRSVCL